MTRKTLGANVTTDQNKNLAHFVIIAALLLAIRLVSLWLGNAPLFFDEAQYWAWAKQPDFGYYSKPPLLAWIIGVVTGFAGNSEFGVRLASPLIHTATGVVLYFTAARLFDSRTGFWAGILYLTLPAVSLSSTLISTDVPLLFCWSLALFCFVYLQSEQTFKAGLALGLCIGAGLMAKYAMIYFVLCLVSYCLWHAERRALLKAPILWLATLIAVLLVLPNVWWNFTHDFATAGHIGDNIGWRGKLLNFDRLGEFVGSQFGVFGPILFGIYLVALIRLWIEGATKEQQLLIAFSLPVLLLISVQALLSKAYANWAATAFPAATILLAHLFVTRIPAWWNRLSLGLHLFVAALIAIAVGFALPGQLPLKPKQNPFSRMWEGPELAQLVKDEIAANPDISYAYVLTQHRKHSANLIYYLRDLAPLRVLTTRPGEHAEDHFQLTRAIEDIPDAALGNETSGMANILFVSTNAELPPHLAERFKNANPLGARMINANNGQRSYLFRLKATPGS